MTTTPQVPIHCPEKLKPGGCQLHNLHCGWPKCNEKTPVQQPVSPMVEAVTKATWPTRQDVLDWAVGRWRAEVENCPLVNVHRRTLDDTWRQVIRFTGGDPDVLIGPAHDSLLAASKGGST